MQPHHSRASGRCLKSSDWRSTLFAHRWPFAGKRGQLGRYVCIPKLLRKNGRTGLRARPWLTRDTTYIWLDSWLKASLDIKHLQTAPPLLATIITHQSSHLLREQTNRCMRKQVLQRTLPPKLSTSTAGHNRSSGLTLHSAALLAKPTSVRRRSRSINNDGSGGEAPPEESTRHVHTPCQQPINLSPLQGAALNSDPASPFTRRFVPDAATERQLGRYMRKGQHFASARQVPAGLNHRGLG